MQTYQRAHFASQQGPGSPRTASPQEILCAIDRLAADIKRDSMSPMYGVWALNALATKLQMRITTTVTASNDPVEGIDNVGNFLVVEFASALDRHPDQTAQVLAATMQVIDRIVAEVKKRGMAR